MRGKRDGNREEEERKEGSKKRKQSGEEMKVREQIQGERREVKVLWEESRKQRRKKE